MYYPEVSLKKVHTFYVMSNASRKIKLIGVLIILEYLLVLTTSVAMIKYPDKRCTS